MSRDEVADEEGFAQFEKFLEEWSRRDFLKRMGGAAAFMAFSGGLAAFLEACASGSNTNSGNAVKGGKLIEGTISDISTFNTLNSGDTSSTQMITLTHDGLLSLTAHGDNIAALASDLPKISSDSMTFTFKLRSGLKWSDGQPITADDVAFTYNLIVSPDTKGFVSRYRAQLGPYIQSVTATDQQTVVFQMSKVLANFQDTHCRYGILPKHILGSVDPKALNTHDYFRAPTCASGVFKFNRWDKGQQVVLDRNPNYWAGQSNLDQYIFKVVTDAVVLAQQLKTGELDVGNPDPSQFDNVKAANNLTTLAFPRPSWDYYQFQLGAGTKGATLFGDKNVRKALHSALDRTAIAKAAYFGQAQPADSVEPPTTWAFNPGVNPKYPYDKAKAEQLLDAAGWAKGSDGVRAKNGVRLSFELNTNSGNNVRQTLIQIMQQQWHDIGVEATPRPIAFQTLVNAIRNTHAFDVILIGIAFGDTDPDQTTLWTTSGIGSGGLNGMQYSNAQVDQLMAQALTTTDRSKRKPLYFQIQDILADELPAPILTVPFSLWGINNRVKNFNTGPYNIYNARPWMKDVYVTDGK